MKILERCVEISHDFLKKAVKEGDIVIDATAGNGNDTALLAFLVGETGTVYSFDIQSIAIENTKMLLIDKDILDRVQLINDSHENIDKYVSKPISAVVFNLGYLPNGDTGITTKAETTINAIKKILTLLKINGIISIVIYTEHDDSEEGEKVLKYLSAINQKQFAVQMIKMINFKKNPPIVVTVEKIA